MAVVLVLALAGCETDNRRCLHSHTDLIPITTVNAQGQPSISWMYVDTCDKYEEPTP
ncbi:hypothetical protein [Streptomyces sp. NBC_01751]|uniref:hypothetical protein n=1 Tax=Streptomyces sp. NBC_01751 TaxID=2975929 RepID=UPI002DD99948|nr:hypothetical protein [Streptomyces sp. NBC_01751]WSD24514.1 hypothetical protein OHA26_14050 [Streptomyces sp. NBC_01751]